MVSRKLCEIFVLVLLNLVLCDCGGIFHVGSELRLSPDSQSTYFGYSIILTPKNVFVGAPKGRNRGNNTVSTGVVFTCDLRGRTGNNLTCNPLNVSNVRSRQASYFSQESMESSWQEGMWFGATIAIVPDNNLMICAPRWWTPIKQTHQLVQGLCFVQNIEEKRVKLSRVLKLLGDRDHQAFLQPILKFPTGSRKEYLEFGRTINYYAYGQSGMSLSVSGNNIILGAPGLVHWTGGVVHTVSKPQTKLLTFERQQPANTYFTNQLGPDDYFGYSVQAAVFQSNGSLLFVAGAPRSKMCFGQVLVFDPPIYETKPLSVRASLRGPQLGAYFGASLCCTDVDSDGRVDLLVGAPNFVKKNEDLPYDQGAVFVFLNRVENQTDFVLKDVGSVSGSGVSGARFGTAIVDIGDVDGDGYTDIAIGAPFENEGQGAVYIYGGSAKGLRSTYSQRIVGPNSRGFGISISKGVDIDGNNCNDFAVGAHESGTAYIFRCVPTMKVSAAIKVPDAVDLPENASNFTVIFCVTTDQSKKWPKHKLYLKAVISVDIGEHRAELNGAEEYNIVAEPDARYCKEEIVEIKPTADLSRPIPINFELEVIEAMKGQSRIIGLEVTVINEKEPAFGANVHLILPLPPKRVPSDCTLAGMNLTCRVPAPLMRYEKEIYVIELDYILNLTENTEFKVKGKILDPFYNGNISETSWRELTLFVTPKANFSVTGQTYHSPNRTIPVSRKVFHEAKFVTIAHYYEIINYGPSDWSQFRSVIQIPENVSLSGSIDGCHHDHPGGTNRTLSCTWAAPVNVTLPVVLTLRLDLQENGLLLDEVGSLNITTSLGIENHNRNATVTSMLVLDPAPPVWPLVVGIIGGILLLAVIIAALYKCGFFSRQQREDLKQLKADESQADESQADESQADGSTSDLQLPEMNRSQQELIDTEN